MARSDETEWWFNAVYAAVRRYKIKIDVFQYGIGVDRHHVIYWQTDIATSFPDPDKKY